MRWRFGGRRNAFAFFVSSFPRKRESSACTALFPWTPAFAGVTVLVLASVSARAEDKIRFSYVVPTIDYTPLLAAIDKGYFGDEGIAV
jgi:ABC-type nitrate/sulfonate/bicarbonate transport system substrate-binding protein